MADQQSRGGKKQGQNNPQNPQQHQGTTTTEGRPDAHQKGQEQGGQRSDAQREKDGV